MKIRLLPVLLAALTLTVASSVQAAPLIFSKPAFKDPECRTAPPPNETCPFGRPTINSRQPIWVDTSDVYVDMWGFAPSTNYWSVVAVKPGYSTDFDLALYITATGDSTSRKALSRAWGTDVDFVAVDANIGHVLTTEVHYPYSAMYTGNNGFEIELVRGQYVLGNTAGSTVALNLLASNGFVEVVDTMIQPGQTVTITLSDTPDDDDNVNDGELYLLPASSSTSGWYAQKTTIPTARKSTSGGLGQPESITYTAPATAPANGWYGLVIVDKSGGPRRYTLTRS